ncbi:MAG: hypothetical protein LIP23_09625 [Planctomycetes bacterium]|nr:hypothetical protein [Planctomycetota bacterium]
MNNDRPVPHRESDSGQNKKTPDPTPSLPAGRDLVFFYTHLTQTLQEAFGDARLAEILDELRKQPQGDDMRGADAAFIGRSLRRIGIMFQEQEADAFLPLFVEQVGQAVSRPGWQIYNQLHLFTTGDGKTGVKPVCGATPRCLDCRLTRYCDYFNHPRKPILATMSPVERLLSSNEKALSDAELLALCLFGPKATGRESVVETLLNRYGRLRAVFRALPGEFQAIRDVTNGQVVKLASHAALYRRLLAERRDAMLHISSVSDIYNRYSAELREFKIEAAVLLMLDQHNNVIRDVWYTSQSPNSAKIGIADLLRPTVREFAVRIVLVHNHPSGNPTPSEADRRFTFMLCQACRIFGLDFMDHVIITESSYFSFRETGILRDMNERIEPLLGEEMKNEQWDLDDGLPIIEY